MDKWKKKIIKSMVRQWKKEYISANDILKYFNDPKNYYEITQEMMDSYENSISFRIIKLFWPIYRFINRKKLDDLE